MFAKTILFCFDEWFHRWGRKHCFSHHPWMSFGWPLSWHKKIEFRLTHTFYLALPKLIRPLPLWRLWSYIPRFFCFHFRVWGLTAILQRGWWRRWRRWRRRRRRWWSRRRGRWRRRSHCSRRRWEKIDQRKRKRERLEKKNWKMNKKKKEERWKKRER